MFEYVGIEEEMESGRYFVAHAEKEKKGIR
jgi:hypothetical protein